jgi:hypothetical protein
MKAATALTRAVAVPVNRYREVIKTNTFQHSTPIRAQVSCQLGASDRIGMGSGH